jgi:sec-independent protein translocase protein TatA
MGDLFDSWWKVLIIAIVVLVLFGSKKLPGAAKSLGQSMRIFKSEVSKIHEDDEETVVAPAASITAAPAAAAAAPASSAPDQQAQIDALQQQIRDLQRASAMDPVPSKQD